ncbi:MAG: hypothetical protein ACRDSZ_11525 [Pseudonocardiaceae bacterium]
MSPGARSSSQTCLPAEIERLLVDVVADGFVVHCCGARTAPLALVASYQWDDYVDLATIRCFDRVTTARVPAPQRRRIDVLAPEAVVWAYEGSAQRALRALLDLVHPQHPDAPATAYPAPPALRIPRAEQRPMTIRLPSPGRVGTGAARLSVARENGTACPTGCGFDEPHRIGHGSEHICHALSGPVPSRSGARGRTRSSAKVKVVHRRRKFT